MDLIKNLPGYLLHTSALFTAVIDITLISSVNIVFPLSCSLSLLRCEFYYTKFTL